MAARKRTESSRRGRHRHSRKRAAVVLTSVAGLFAAASVGAAGIGGGGNRATSGCAGGRTLQVAAAAELVPAVEATARRIAQRPFQFLDRFIVDHPNLGRKGAPVAASVSVHHHAAGGDGSARLSSIPPAKAPNARKTSFLWMRSDRPSVLEHKHGACTVSISLRSSSRLPAQPHYQSLTALRTVPRGSALS